MLIGTNSFEAGFFGPAWYGTVPQKMGELWERARTLTDGYGTGSDELRAAQIGTDRFATMNTRIIAKGGRAASGSGFSLLFLLRLGFTTRHVARSHSHRRDPLRLWNSFS